VKEEQARNAVEEDMVEERRQRGLRLINQVAEQQIRRADRELEGAGFVHPPPCVGEDATMDCDMCDEWRRQVHTFALSYGVRADGGLTELGQILYERSRTVWPLCDDTNALLETASRARPGDIERLKGQRV
jgi:hypothetical protein